MIAIETDRLILRNFRPDDWRDLHEMIVRYQASEIAQYDHQWPTSAEEIRGVAEWFSGGDSYLAVCLKTTHKLIGCVALNQDNDCEDLSFALGYVFNLRYHGRGYATEACRTVIDYAFGTLGADRLTSGTGEANAPSRRLLRRLGLRETGRGTVSFRKTADGKPIEFVGLQFSLSREEWVELSRSSTYSVG